MKKQTNAAPAGDVQREVHPKWAERIATQVREALGLAAIIDVDAHGTTAVVVDRGAKGLLFITAVYFGVYGVTYVNGAPTSQLNAELKKIGVDEEEAAVWRSRGAVRAAIAKAEGR